MSVIPIHHLQHDANLNLNIAPFQIGHRYEANTADVHRDDHYIFFLFERGTATLTIDFQQVFFQESCVFYILPGQVHHRLYNQQAQGWYLAVDTGLVPSEFRAIFEGYLGVQQPLYLDQRLVQQCTTLLQLIWDRSQGEAPFQSNITLTLFQSLAGIIAEGYRLLTNDMTLTTKPRQLTYAFRKLVIQQFRSLKSPSHYADQLNVSVNYLNEVSKKTTGFTASYWINQQLLLEAKRLLIYSRLDIKEIAYNLGYADPVYFSKWFKKHVSVHTYEVLNYM